VTYKIKYASILIRLLIKGIFMKIINRVCLFLIFITFQSLLGAIEKEEVITGQYFVSQDIEDFDCHSSSLIASAPGKLCAVWKGGPGKGSSSFDIKENVGIWLSLFENNNWSIPRQIVEAADSVCWSPVLTKHPSGKLILFYRIGADPRHTVSLFKTSHDNGLNWSAAQILPAGIVGPTKTKPVFDDQGNMLCGSSVEVGEPEDELKATACWIEILGQNQRWSKHGPIAIKERPFGCIEPVLFWGNNGTLKMLCRDRSHKMNLDGWIRSAESLDKGKTWSELEKTTLPNPDAGIDALNCIEGEVVLIFNNSHTDRYPLTLALSKDYGQTWTTFFDLEEESGEFPSITQDVQGFLHVTYAYKQAGQTQRRIKHVVIDLKKLSGLDDLQEDA